MFSIVPRVVILYPGPSGFTSMVLYPTRMVKTVTRTLSTYRWLQTLVLSILFGAFLPMAWCM